MSNRNIEHKSKDIEEFLRKNPEKLQNLIEENPNVRDFAMMVSEERFHSGPIPSPDTLKGYADVDSSFPGRIFLMAEKQSNHRMDLEKEVIKSNIKNERTGMFLGAFISILTILGGIYLIAIDKDITGFSTILIAIAAIVGIFIKNKNSEKEEVSQNNKDLQSKEGH